MTKELKGIIKNMEQTIEKQRVDNQKLKEMIQSFREIIGNDNFDAILNLQGYKLKK